MLFISKMMLNQQSHAKDKAADIFVFSLICKDSKLIFSKHIEKCLEIYWASFYTITAQFTSCFIYVFIKNIGRQEYFNITRKQSLKYK